MNWRDRQKMFLTAVEIYQVSQSAGVGGVSRKLAELEQHVANGGSLSRGALFTQAGRGCADGWLNWALDFLGCLPECRRKRRMIVRHYCGDEDKAASMAAIGPLREFWAEVKSKGLIGSGEKIFSCL